MTEQDATTVGWPPKANARFEMAAPRHFLLPAVLLLLAEQPRHGYSLAKGIQELRIGRGDRPSVYRALAQLERDGLVESSTEAPHAGQSRRAYCLTEQGEHLLRQWMGVIKQERDGLDRVLRRYVATGTVDAVLAEVEGRWHPVTATPWSPVSSTSRLDRTGPPPWSAVPDVPDRIDRGSAAVDAMHVERTRFRLVPDRSVVLIEARSSAGPITFGAIGLRGTIEAAVAGRRICSDARPTAHLEVDVERLESGNRLYDAELSRRIDARRHPTVSLDLRECTALGSTGRFRLGGQMTFHGVSRPLDGTVAVVLPSSRVMVVRGEHVVDIRDFGMALPTVLMLRIYPDVMVKLQVEAELDELSGASSQ